MAYRLEWRPEARADMRALVRYIGRDNPKRARDFARELQDKASTLAEFPQIGRKNCTGLAESVRELVVHRNYVIFYRVLDENRMVEVLRVKHSAQQMP